MPTHKAAANVEIITRKTGSGIVKGSADTAAVKGDFFSPLHPSCDRQPVHRHHPREYPGYAGSALWQSHL